MITPFFIMGRKKKKVETKPDINTIELTIKTLNEFHKIPFEEYEEDSLISLLSYHGYTVAVFIDDPGQQYYFKVYTEDKNKNPKILEASCGAYNFALMTELKDYIDFIVDGKKPSEYDNLNETIYRIFIKDGVDIAE